MKNVVKRCEWTSNNHLLKDYHDKEWGIPLHDDNKLFEFLVLDTFQAGLSWLIVLSKRNNFRKAMNNFDFKKIAKYDNKEIKRLVLDQSIIRNRLKIEATIDNAKKFIEVQKEFGTFDRYIWKFTNFKTINHKFKYLSQLPSKTKESDEMSTDLKKRGFKFVGSTTCYAFMQAIGMVNDHTIKCFIQNNSKN